GGALDRRRTGRAGEAHRRSGTAVALADRRSDPTRPHRADRRRQGLSARLGGGAPAPDVETNADVARTECAAATTEVLRNVLLHGSVPARHRIASAAVSGDGHPVLRNDIGRWGRGLSCGLRSPCLGRSHDGASAGAARAIVERRRGRRASVNRYCGRTGGVELRRLVWTGTSERLDRLG